MFEGDCITFFKWHLLQITLAPWHMPQAVVDRNACQKEGETHKDAERRVGGRKECECVSECIRESEESESNTD